MAQKRPPGPGRRSRAPTEVDKRVGQNIRARRNDMHMTLAELAERLNVTHQQLQKYETAQNRVSASMVLDITQVLNISIEDLFYDAGLQKGKAPDALETARRECRMWVDRAHSVEALNRMASVLKALSGKETLS
jgi:transcriptional regulator with XRE-family HTH domain